MAIVALILALILVPIALSRNGRALRKLLLTIATIAAVFALYLALAEPALAWDLRWVGRLLTRLAGHSLRQLMH